jgi:hypothetical protein
MKRVGFIVLFLALFLGACKKKQIKNIEKAMVEGTWKVTKYVAEGEDYTSLFSSSTFTFSENGSVTITGAMNVTGTWDVAKENDSDDDDISDDKHVEFILNLPYPYDELSEDWEIESNSDSKLELKDKSNNGESVDYLTFEKN